jgi:uncharacterized protein YndB with AHSA1/START domain
VKPPEPAGAWVQRVVPASPDEVFHEWVDAEAMREWMCPRPAHATNVALDPVVGGQLRIDISDQGSGFYVSGTYLELDPPHRLSFTWSCSIWDDPTVQSVVTVTLQPHDESSTLMTINHVLLPASIIEDYQRGWTAIADQLESRLIE